MASDRSEKPAEQRVANENLPMTSGTTPRVQISCNLSLSSCRRWATLQRGIANRRLAEEHKAASRLRKVARGGRAGANGS